MIVILVFVGSKNETIPFIILLLSLNDFGT